MNNYIKKASNLSKRTPFILFFIVAAGSLASLIFIGLTEGPQKLGLSSWIDRSAVIGFFCLIITSFASLCRSLQMMIRPEKRIVSYLGNGSPTYSIKKIMDVKFKKLYIIGQNLLTITSSSEFHDRLKKRFEKAKTDNDLHVYLIGATYDGMKVIGSECAQDFQETLKNIKFLYDQIPEASKRLSVCFHPSAISLSAIVRDPQERSRGLAIFTVKWAKDNNPDDRLQCVVEKAEHPDLFGKIAGHLRAMTEGYSMKLSDISSEIEKDIKLKKIVASKGIEEILTYFINREDLT